MRCGDTLLIPVLERKRPAGSGAGLPIKSTLKQTPAPSTDISKIRVKGLKRLTVKNQVLFLQRAHIQVPLPMLDKSQLPVSLAPKYPMLSIFLHLHTHTDKYTYKQQREETWHWRNSTQSCPLLCTCTHMQIWNGGPHLSSQHLGSRGRRASFRPSWIHTQVQRHHSHAQVCDYSKKWSYAG